MSEEKQGNQSEVARLRKQIADEYEAAQRGLYGSAQGAGSHAFITKRMEAMGLAHKELINLVGEEEAAKILIETMNKQEKDKGTS